MSGTEGLTLAVVAGWNGQDVAALPREEAERIYVWVREQAHLAYQEVAPRALRDRYRAANAVGTHMSAHATASTQACRASMANGMVDEIERDRNAYDAVVYVKGLIALRIGRYDDALRAGRRGPEKTGREDDLYVAAVRRAELGL